MNIKKQANSIRSYGTPSVFRGVNLWTYDYTTHKWSFNGQVVEMPSPPVPTDTTQLFAGKGSFQKNLELLNARINTIHKELTYWDLYQINTSIPSPESFPSIISSLAVGNSAVVNCDTFSYSNIIYHRGDIITKINDSQEIHIPAVNSGTYKPGSIEQIGDTANYRIIYEYQPDPHQGEIVSPAGSIHMEDSSTYGEVLDFAATTTHEFNVLKKEGRTIIPVIKFFRENEQIVLDACTDFSLTEGSTTFTLTLTNTMDVKAQVK